MMSSVSSFLNDWDRKISRTPGCHIEVLVHGFRDSILAFVFDLTPLVERMLLFSKQTSVKNCKQVLHNKLEVIQMTHMTRRGVRLEIHDNTDI